MDAVVVRFIRLLKRAGIGISPSETIDAMQALSCVALADREAVRTVLRATLVKKLRDIPVFDALFDLFFVAPARGRPADGCHGRGEETHAPVLGPRDAAAGDVDMTGETDAILENVNPEKIVARSVLLQEPNELSLPGKNGRLVLNAEKAFDKITAKITHYLRARRATNVSRPGELNLADNLSCINDSVINEAVQALLDDLHDLALEDTLFERLDNGPGGSTGKNLPSLADRYAQRDFEHDPASRKKAHPTPACRSFTDPERRSMEDVVRRLGRRLRGARSSRRVISPRGRINIGSTLRKSLAYDGVPFNPVLTKRRNDKPRIVILCDVSLSVRNTARLMLHLVYSLQAFFEQVRSFVFVSDIADATRYFEELPIDAAISAVFSGDLIDCDADSDYGRALGMFCQRHIGAVNDRTTVIVLGDGRGNRNPPNVGALEEIRRRSKQLVWLAPEPRGSWGLGSSDMPLYEPLCHRAEVVRSLEQLAEVSESLFRGRAHPPRRAAAESRPGNVP
jgi:uncharacterized protein with von Willebrand factor type A (vWA) domain